MATTPGIPLSPNPNQVNTYFHSTTVVHAILYIFQITELLNHE